MLYEVQQTDVFSGWLAALRDSRGRAKIARRADRMRRGNFGDHKSVGDGVFEMRIDEGPGYRVYYVERGGVRVVLLCGGDKDDQQRDIKRAKELAKEV